MPDARKEATIFDSVSNAPLDDRYSTGAIPGEGTFFCLICGSQLSMQETDALPECPRCGGDKYRRDSIFAAHQDHSATTSEFPVPSTSAPPSWLEKARTRAKPGNCLAMQADDGEIRIFQIERGWTRIGRSLTADFRLDDPSVSRRHALVVAEPGKPLRILDDRSLNGVFVNGETVEWAPLHDGDELAVGRYSLYVLHN
ncbi:MAG TPA: FHA domain-containing protein [Solirubrobacterales bacterium]|nr:FHA domain-containing protein [Solirubrobacterales bacterium]